MDFIRTENPLLVRMPEEGIGTAQRRGLGTGGRGRVSGGHEQLLEVSDAHMTKASR